MAEKQTALKFSEQVDSLLAGQTPPGDDPLLSLASEMVADLAMAPSPMFARQLRHQLLRSMPPGRTARPRWRWSLAGVAVTLLLAFVLVLAGGAGSPSVAEVLARAADAMAAEPGQIEHWVMRLDFTPLVEGSSEIGSGPIHEYWSRVGTTPDGRLTSVEFVDIGYREDDLSNPVSQGYCTSSRICTYDFEHPSAPHRWWSNAENRWLDADSEGCITHAEPADNDPGPLAPYAGESLQVWIGRMQDNSDRIEFRQDRFEGRLVYSLAYTEVTTQSATWHPADTGDPSSEAVVQALEEKLSRDIVVTYTTTLYVDRETFLPIGAVVISPDNIFTQIVLLYEVLDPDDLDFDPFAWPPA